MVRSAFEFESQVLRQTLFAADFAFRESDGRVIQLGIVRINFDFLDPEVRQEIVAERTPLGHILIGHNVLREIELWRCGVLPRETICAAYSVLHPSKLLLAGQRLFTVTAIRR